MKITTQIECDCKSLNAYFLKLFNLYGETLNEQRKAPIEIYSDEADASQVRFNGFSHLIKPDMLMNIYSLLDYWLVELCEYHRKRLNLQLGHNDINAKNDLAKAHKYLARYAGLDLSTVNQSFDKLNQLRIVRNAFMHGGGHVKQDREPDFTNIKGVSMFGSLLIIEPDFIWDSLRHAEKYLLTIAETN